MKPSDVPEGRTAVASDRKRKLVVLVSNHAGKIGQVTFTPANARELAYSILRVADELDGKKHGVN